MALEKFCFCCKLRNGVFIWGILCIIRSFIVFVTAVASGEIYYSETPRNIFGDDESLDSLNYNGMVHSTNQPSWSPVYWLIFIASFVDLITSILLVVGAVKRNHFLMLPWIILNGIALVPFGIATVAILIILLPIYGPVYIWWCVCSAYQNVQENPPPPYDKFDSLLLSDSMMNAGTMS